MQKPFAMEELVARVRTRLRGRGMEEQGILGANDVQLDLLTRRVTVGGRPVALSPREFSLLETLLRRVGQVLTRQQLLSHVWGYPYDPTTNVVNVYVNALRKKIGPDKIETVRGLGYRFRRGDEPANARSGAAPDAPSRRG
jgi:DNA-binding response OmpR family regulator